MSLLRNTFFACTLLLLFASCGKEVDSAHPRLFMRAGQEQNLIKNIQSDSLWTEMHEAILDECDTICALPPMERVLEGPRLHAVSCEVLRRVLFLSYAYRCSERERYLQRAETEMLAAADFVDWNPSHFLDVAEMTTALAIGYDWLYDKLSADTRAILVEAICQKGLLPSEDEKYYQAFMVKHSRFSNWGQVCHGGLAIGAIAVMEEAPELANRILERSKEYIKLPMGKAYPPEGCYPEGFGYWAFGTQYNVLFLSALENYYGKKSIEEYIQTPGFLQTGNFSQQLITPGLHTFSYSDNSTRIYIEPVSMWFYAHKPDPAMFYMQKYLLEKFNADAHSYTKTIKNRLVPMMLIWGAGTSKHINVSLSDATMPTTLFYEGVGENAIAVMRSSWLPDASYLGFKSGRPNNFHGHQDIGSFYLEMGGAVWSTDLGSDHYGDIAKAKISMFNMKQDSPRWTKLTKYNNFAHSTLSVNSEYQKADGQCYIEQRSDDADYMWAESDLTPAIGHKVVRRAALRQGKIAEITDTVVCSEEKACDYVWNMTTPASLVSVEGRNITLRNADTYLTMEIDFDTPRDFKVDFVPATPRNAFEGQNDGISFLKISYTLEAGEQCVMTVKMKNK